jgi:hypothetical protein
MSQEHIARVRRRSLPAQVKFHAGSTDRISFDLDK